MFALIVDGIVKKYPYSSNELRNDNLQTSFPDSITLEILAEWNVFSIEEIAKPNADYTKTVIERTPKMVNGKWVQVWEVVDASAEEIKERIDTQAASVRSQRNELLKNSDWTQVLDAPVDKTAWAIYRQELRDITAQSGFPWNVVWPIQPMEEA